MFCCWSYFFFFLSNELLDEAEQRAFVLIKCIICPQTTKFSPKIRKLNVQNAHSYKTILLHYIVHIFIICPQTTKCQNQSLNQMSKNAHSYLNINFIKVKYILLNLWYIFLASAPEYFLVFNCSPCCLFQGTNNATKSKVQVQICIVVFTVYNFSPSSKNKFNYKSKCKSK